MTRRQWRRERRKRQEHQWMYRAAMAGVVVMMLCLICFTRSDRPEERVETFGERKEELNLQRPFKQVNVVKEAAGQQDKPDRYAVFDSMSADWGTDDCEGFRFYAIPQEYECAGGYFPEKMQVYTYCVCKQYEVSYPLVIALIERESGYVFDRMGDDGNSFGYMQIYERFHADRMERLSVDDLLNPYQNVLVGIDYLAELIGKYGTEQEALAAYNYGERGAREHLWDKGIYVYPYNKEITDRAKQIEEGWSDEKDN